MHVEIHQRENEGIVILDLKGRLVLGPEDIALREYLQSMRERGRTNVMLDLREVSQIDTAGLGSLVYFAQKFHAAGGRLVLLNQARATKQLRFDAALETYADEQTAINSFFPDRAVPRYDILEFVEEQEQRRASELDPGKR